MLIVAFALLATLVLTQFYIEKVIASAGFNVRYPSAPRYRWRKIALKSGFLVLIYWLATVTPYPFKQALCGLSFLMLVSFAADTTHQKIRWLLDCSATFGPKSREYKVVSIFNIFASLSILLILTTVAFGGLLWLYIASLGGEPTVDLSFATKVLLAIGITYMALTYLVNGGFYRETLKKLEP